MLYAPLVGDHAPLGCSEAPPSERPLFSRCNVSNTFFSCFQSLCDKLTPRGVGIICPSSFSTNTRISNILRPFACLTLTRSSSRRDRCTAPITVSCVAGLAMGHPPLHAYVVHLTTICNMTF